MSMPTVFSFETHAVRSLLISDQPWFVASDVCAALSIENNRNATARLDDDEKDVRTMDTPSGKQELTIINESGLYSLILGSRKAEAKKFKKWVTAEVLPSIRKTGSYTHPATQKALPGKLTKESQDQIKAAIRERLEALPKAQQGKYAIQIWSAINTKFGTKGMKDGYKNIPDEACIECLSLIARFPIEGEVLPPEHAHDVAGEIKALQDAVAALSKQRKADPEIPAHLAMIQRAMSAMGTTAARMATCLDSNAAALAQIVVALK